MTSDSTPAPWGESAAAAAATRDRRRASWVVAHARGVGEAGGVSIYGVLLSQAWADRPDEPAATVAERVRQLDAARAASGGGDVAADLAGQLRYDVALLALADAGGLSVDLGTFDRPEEGRARLERSLAEAGVLPAPDAAG